MGCLGFPKDIWNVVDMILFSEECSSFINILLLQILCINFLLEIISFLCSFLYSNNFVVKCHKFSIQFIWNWFGVRILLKFFHMSTVSHQKLLSNSYSCYSLKMRSRNIIYCYIFGYLVLNTIITLWCVCLGLHY